MSFNRETLFAYLRKAPFGGRLTQAQVDGVNAVLKAWDDSNAADVRCLAYILATAFHETGGTMQPVREGFAKTDAGARKVVANRKYGKPDPVTGYVYYGRGLVQLTWAANYKTMGSKLLVDLYRKPDMALQPDISADILVTGMLDGMFTGKRVSDYFTVGSADPVRARQVVNKMDKADLIAGHYTRFLAALEAASAPVTPKDVVAKDAKPDGGNLAKDKTVLGFLSSVASAGGLGVFAGIDNPWAFGAVAFAILIGAIGAWLFLSGRLEIRRKAGA